MESKINEIEINGIVYVPKSEVSKHASNKEGLKMVMVRTYSAGVHYGFLKKRDSTLAGIEVELIEARRVWQWSGAASLSQLAMEGTNNVMEGTNNVNGCKMPCTVDVIELLAIEIIQMTAKSLKSLNSVPIWKK